jgi:hypothetical protein
MNHLSLATISALALFAAAGCSASTATPAGSEDTLDTASALSSESTSTDPVEDGVVSDGDVDGASAEAVEAGFDAPRPLDLGCGIRKSIRERIKEHFDANGDGKLEPSERAALKDALGDHARGKIELAKLGVMVRHHVWKRIVWAYDVDDSGSLDAGERADLASAVQARCEARKVRVLANWDANKDGQLDDGELKAAIDAFVKARREAAMKLLAKIDTNDDHVIDAAERAAAKQAFMDRYAAKRDAVKAKYDVNGDGKLDESELAALKSDIRARFENEPPAE